MPKINTISTVSVPKLSDKLIGTSVGGTPSNQTNNFTLQQLKTLFEGGSPPASPNLQSVLNAGNTATQSIYLTGTLEATNATIANNASSKNLYLSERFFDRNNFQGTSGQYLTSTGTGVQWSTLTIAIPTLQQVLTAGNVSDKNIITTGNIQAANLQSTNLTANSNLRVVGTFSDSSNSAGTSNQVLSSTVVGTSWVDLPSYSAVSPLIYNNTLKQFSIQQATGTQNGYLSSADWITFNGKQNAGNYITALTGEASASGPGSVSITLNNLAVINKTLTGFTALSGVVTAADSIISAFGKVQGQINGIVAGVVYQGVWNAATNTPVLVSGVGVQGHYYVVDVAGNTNLDGITDWQVGDWVIFNGTDWQKVDNTDAVISVNGQIGIVVLNSDNIAEGTTNLYYTDTRARNSISSLATGLTYTAGTGVFSLTAGYSIPTIANQTDWTTAYNNSIVSAAVTGTTTKTLTLTQQDGGTITASWTDIDTNLVTSVFGRTGAVVAQNGDYSTTLVTEGTNLYYLDSRARAAISSSATGLTYTPLTGDFSLTAGYSIPTNLEQADWDTAYNNSIVSAAVTGTSTKTLTLNQQDGGTITANWTDDDTGLTSVGLSMPSAFSVANSPLTADGTIAVSGAGTASQYVRGDGTLANFPTTGGGGSSVNYYLNGSVNQGTFGGDTYYEMSKTPIFGAGTDFTRTNAQGDGYIASFITDAGDPALLNIPGGNWNIEIYFSLSSGGGTPSFYGELYKVSSTNVFTLIGSGATNPEVLDGGTATDQYYTSIPVAQTPLLVTDRLAIRLYVTPNGRDITLHTEDNNLCEVLTTFSTGLNALNGLTAQVQYFQTGTSGTDFNISSVTDIHTFNLPTASAANRGALSADDWSTFNTKVGSVTASSPLASSGGQTPNITIQQSSGSQDGYLSSTDWTTFNNKQAAGNYITSLTGEATASGPGAASVTLNNASVTAKVLTGVNITGGSISATDSILTAFGKVQNQINGLVGGSIYQGTWNAATNTPALASGVGTKGYYYIVSVAGTTNLDGITDWFVGDWAIFDGTAWQQVDNTDAVVSVNGQTGAVSLTTDNIPEGSTNLYYLDSRARAALSFTAGSGAYNSTTGVITIPTNTSQLTNGANFITLASLSGTAPIVYSNTTGAISITQSGTASNGYLSSTDWNTFNNKQATITLTTTGTSGAATLVGTTLNIPNYVTDLSGYVTLGTTQTLTGLKTILRGGDVLNFKIGTDTLYGLKIAYNQNELVPSGEATWSFVNTFNNGSGTGIDTTPISFFRGVLVTGQRLLSSSVNANLLDYYGNNPSGRYPIYAYNTGVQQFASSIIVGETAGVVNAITGAIADLPSGVVANFKGRVIGSNAVNSNEFATLGQIPTPTPSIMVAGSGTCSTLRNGVSNNASGNYSFAGGGFSNTASGAISSVVGGCANTASGSCSFIGGGRFNVVCNNIGVVAGGFCNCATALSSTISGGSVNRASGTNSTIGGGANNLACSFFSTISGGQCNTSSSSYSFVGGGNFNTASGLYSFVGGGRSNTASGSCSTVGGGVSNNASGFQSTVSGGWQNTASGNYSGIFGGKFNTISSSYLNSFIIGSNITANIACTTFVNDLSICSFNSCSGCSVCIGSNGLLTAASGGGSIIIAGTGFCSTIRCGVTNNASGNFSTASGGYFNTASGYCSTVGGGYFNTASNNSSFVGGGCCNTASNNSSFVGGGCCNTASGCRSMVVSGENNTACSSYSGVAVGYCNRALSGNVINCIAAGYLCADSGSPFSACGYICLSSFDFSNCFQAGNQYYFCYCDFPSVGNCGTFSLTATSSTSTCYNCFSFCDGQTGMTGCYGIPICIPSGAAINQSVYQGSYGFVGGGCCNIVGGPNSFIGAGNCNSITSGGYSSGIVGGSLNKVNGNTSFIGGGYNNSANGNSSTVVGGNGNTASNSYSFVANGIANKACAYYSFIGGGLSNTASGGASFVGMGSSNISSGWRSFIGNGQNNTASNSYSFLGGGYCNTASGYYSFLGGGCCNTASGACSVILGGVYNTASNTNSFIGNGFFNTVSGYQSVVVGGAGNSVSGCCSGILGGFGNTITHTESFIIGANLTSSANCTTYVNALSKTSGTFRINHPDPTKTATHYLQHSFVESPTRGDNIYRYKITTCNCAASVELPEYYRFLNEDDQVWVSPIGHFGSAYGVIDSCQKSVNFVSNADGEYNVLIIGTRKDIDAKNGFDGVEILKNFK
jgi:hypothetical protein